MSNETATEITTRWRGGEWQAVDTECTVIATAPTRRKLQEKLEDAGQSDEARQVLDARREAAVPQSRIDAKRKG